MQNIKLKKMKTFVTFMLLLISLPILSQNDKSHVLILSTLHRNHLTNKNYTYEHLDSIVKNFDADVIAVEIRQEDIDKSKEYIAKYYPLEMHKYLNADSEKKYYGFDWLGEEIKGKTLSEDYFNNVNVMRVLQQKLNLDEDVKKKLTVLDPVKNEKFDLIKNATAQELIGGTYDLLSNIYYNQMKIILTDTPYYGIYDFSLKRDEEIAKNITNIIKSNPNKKILVLLGADHRSYTIKFLENQKDLDFNLIKNF